MGLMVAIFSPDLDLTNSLSMNRPRGWVYLRPLGAVSSTKRSDMLWTLLQGVLSGEVGVVREVRETCLNPGPRQHQREKRGARLDIYLQI